MGPLAKGLAPPRQGTGNPEPQLQTHHDGPRPPWPLGALPVIQSGGNWQGPLSPRRPSKAHRAKTLGPTLPLASALTSVCPSTCCTAGRLGLLASWVLTLSWPPRGPSQGAWRLNEDWGPPSPSARLTLPSRCHMGHYGHCRSFRAGEQAEPFEPLATFEGLSRQNAWAHAPARHRPHLGQPLLSPHIWRIGPAALLEANPNHRSAPGGALPRGLVPPSLGLRTPEPHHQTHPAAPPPPGLLEAPLVIQGRRTGRALRAPSDHRRLPVTKRLGPRSRSPAHSTRPATPLTAQPADRACRPPLG